MVICYISGYEIESIFKSETDFYSNEKGMKMDEEEDNNTNIADISTNNVEIEEFTQIKIKTKRNKNEMEVKDITSKIQNIVTDLLYNENERNRIDTFRKKELEILCRKTIYQYYKQSKKEYIRPNYWKSMEIIEQQSIKKQRLINIPYESNRVLFYTQIIQTLWSIIHQSIFYKEKKTKLNARQHVLGALYILNSPTKEEDIGYSINCDDYLYRYLPSQNDLKDWNGGKYDKSDITKGRNNIKSSIASFSKDEKKGCFDLLLKIRNYYMKKLQFSPDYMPFYSLFISESQNK
jgi:hypothetical protein